MIIKIWISSQDNMFMVSFGELCTSVTEFKLNHSIPNAKSIFIWWKELKTKRQLLEFTAVQPWQACGLFLHREVILTLQGRYVLLWTLFQLFKRKYLWKSILCLLIFLLCENLFSLLLLPDFFSCEYISSSCPSIVSDWSHWTDNNGCCIAWLCR